MTSTTSHIPFLETITDFFKVYGIGKPLHPDFMCMRLEDQPDEKLMHMPLCRTNFFRIVHFCNSGLEFIGAQSKVEVSGNSICFSYPGKLESWKRIGRLYGYVTYFTSTFVHADFTAKNFEQDYPFFDFNPELVLPLEEDESAGLRQLASQMAEEIHSNSNDKLEMSRRLLFVYLHTIKRIYSKWIASFSEGKKENRALYNRFRKELDDYMQRLSVQEENDMPSVSAIAKNLSVNANYLNGVIKKLTGKPASEHISDKLVLEAKAFHLHTDLPVSDIAFRLGFRNTSYFNRFFKKHTGLTPSSFRKQLSS